MVWRHYSLLLLSNDRRCKGDETTSNLLPDSRQDVRLTMGASVPEPRVPRGDRTQINAICHAFAAVRRCQAYRESLELHSMEKPKGNRNQQLSIASRVATREKQRIIRKRALSGNRHGTLPWKTPVGAIVLRDGSSPPINESGRGFVVIGPFLLSCADVCDNRTD